MNSRSLFCLRLLFLLPVGFLVGCGHSTEPESSAELPVVPVSQPVQRQVTDFVDYTGRTAAVNSVDIRPRVSGYLTKMPFKEGEEVKEGVMLFEIDPRPYQAQVDQAEAQVNLNLAKLRLAKANNNRARTVANREPGAFSQQELDTYQAQELENDAAVKASRATLEVYKLNRSFCEVRSPITGQVSRYYYTLGNLVNQDQTPLTTVVSVDPMYVYFDMDERTVLDIRKRVNAGEIKAPKNTTELTVFMGLEGEKDYSHRGKLNFINNQVNPQTGTITVRGEFDNPKPPEGRRLLVPGMFVRIHLPIGPPHDALLVADRAIGSDQGLKFVYVLDRENKVQYRRVTTGALQEDGLRVIDRYREMVNDKGETVSQQGVRPEEWVIVGALPQVRPRMEIDPEQVAMPVVGAGEAPSPVPPRPQPPPAGESNPRTSQEKRNEEKR